MIDQDNIINATPTADESPIARDRSWQTTLSRVVSLLLHPFLVPLYVGALLLFGDELLSRMSAPIISYLVWIIVMYVAVVPIISILFLRAIGVLKDFGLHSQRQRIIPLIVGVICYLLCAKAVDGFPGITVIHKFLLAAACCEALALVVTPFWKISLHSICMGGATALFVLLSVAGTALHFWALVVTLLLSGVLASARLHLGAHNPTQIAAGYFGGMAVAMVVIIYL